MAEVLVDLFQTTLTAGIDNIVTTVTVPVAALPAGFAMSAGDTAHIVVDPGTATQEVMRVTSFASLNLTVVRGIASGTTGAATPLAHANAAVVQFVLCKEGLLNAIPVNVNGMSILAADQNIVATTFANLPANDLAVALPSAGVYEVNFSLQCFMSLAAGHTGGTIYTQLYDGTAVVPGSVKQFYLQEAASNGLAATVSGTIRYVATGAVTLHVQSKVDATANFASVQIIGTTYNSTLMYIKLS